LTAAGPTLTPEPRARLRLTLLGRTVTFTARPWSVCFGRADTMTITAIAPAPPEPVEPCDLIAEIAALAKNAEQTPVLLVADGPNLHTTKAILGMANADATAWGYLSPDSARRRAQRAWDLHYADALHFLAEDVATFAATIVAHHLAPTAQTARDVRLCGIRAAGQIVAMVRKATP
jgi:hypothetical protein